MYSPLPIETSLWDFSLHYYARPGVSQLCLRLQDEHGTNVNVLLWALWLGRRGIQLSPELLESAVREVRRWDQDYVIPLRQLRRQMKTEFGTGNASIESVRAQIKQAELLAEKHLQQLLESRSPLEKKPSIDTWLLMGENLHCYLLPLGVNQGLITDLLARLCIGNNQ